MIVSKTKGEGYYHFLGIGFVIFSDDDWGIQSPSKGIVFRFHETILSFGDPGSLGILNRLCLRCADWNLGVAP